MKFISNHVAVIKTNEEGGSVSFFRKQPEIGEMTCVDAIWIEVADLNAWIACLYDEIRNVSTSINAGTFFVEKTAFDRVTNF